MQYRREIDGLRTIAVMPVILFHANFQIFGGGYSGVDIFFVISGYLITSLILADIEKGRFSIARFYERRARRILPALSVVMLSCVPLAWLWMLPRQFVEFSHSLIAVPLFVSNILFWRETGYFEAASEEKPLLHTWSLAVEEQYYLLFPLLMVLMWRFGRRRSFYVVLALAALSLLLSEWGWRNKPAANFFLAPTRVWELLAGSLCAFIQSSRGQWRGNIPSMAGLGAIVFGILVYDEHTPFPSLYAVVPVLGTVLIILFAAPGTWAARLLSLKPMVAIGLISYSAYLWHQPLFAFARILSPQVPSQGVMLGLAGLTLGLAWLSWRYVEQPFRDRHAPVLATQRAVFVASGAVTGLIIALGVLGSTIAVPKILWNTPDLLTDVPAQNAPYAACPGFEVVQGNTQCRMYGTGGATVVIWGDSHAMPLVRMMSEIEDTRLYVIAHHGCPPLIGVRRRDTLGDIANCTEVGSLNSYAAYIRNLGPDTVVLTGRWSLYAKGWWKRGVLQAETHFITDTQNTSMLSAQAQSQVTLHRALIRTVQKFNDIGAEVLVITPPADLNHLSDRQRILQPKIMRAPIDSWHQVETDMLTALPNTRLLDSKALFCSQDICRTRQDGYQLYSDDNHLSNYGASLQWEMIKRALVSSD